MENNSLKSYIANSSFLDLNIVGKPSGRLVVDYRSH
uniref:Uncharacterized protein n=1 Tax=Siphoviridae sp. ctCIv11 TaxID=2827806 RepID=A0A8S5S1U3_9CAUD|nr:MAG TPA: hypothetical protein [Siphoviridae sp. ctCIv11]